MRSGLVTLLLLTLFWPASPAAAFVTLKRGSSVPTWSNGEITYYIRNAEPRDVTLAQFESAIAAALAAWETLTCSHVRFTYGGRRSSAPSSGVFVRIEETRMDPGVQDAAAYAYTLTNWQGQPTRGEVVFNGVNNRWTTTASQVGAFYSDIQGVGAHEFGHIIGLDHTRDITATMFYSSTGSTTMRTLAGDDQRGACFLYPVSAFTQGLACDSCTDNNHCRDGNCILYYSEPHRFCGHACTTGAQCPEGYYCCAEVHGSGPNECVPDNGYCHDAGQNVGMGGFCYGYEVCQSGLFCLPMGGDAYCTRTCPPDCPEGFRCTSGYCLRGGRGQFGDACTNDYDCASLKCTTVRPGNYICTSACTTAADCPDGAACTFQVCMPRGETEFGGTCSAHVDCQTGYCAGAVSGRYCSLACNVGDSVCPTGSQCLAAGYCSTVRLVTGDVCDAESACPTGDICYFPFEGAVSGHCRTRCNPLVSATGCPSGQVCAWGEMVSLGYVGGVCRAPNGGAPLGEGCYPLNQPCEWNTHCASHEGEAHRCYRHCRTDTNTGCLAAEECVPVGGVTGSVHGYCYREPPPTGNWDDLSTGDVCDGTKPCPDGDICFFAFEGATTGRCFTECDPFRAGGCPAGQVCGWAEMISRGHVGGICRNRNEGAALGEICAAFARSCEWNTVCAAHEGQESLCYRHCRTDTGVGCVAPEVCTPVGALPGSVHGYCYRVFPDDWEPDAGGGDEEDPGDPDVPRPPGEDTGGPDPDPVGPPADGDGGAQQPPVGGDREAPGSGAATSSGGGCATGRTPARGGGGAGPLFLLLLGALFSRRFRTAPRRPHPPGWRRRA